MAYRDDSEDKKNELLKPILSIISLIICIIACLIIFKTDIFDTNIFTEDDKSDLIKISVETEILKETTKYSVISTQNGIEASIWETDNAKIAKKAADGDSDAQTKWNRTKEKMSYLATVIYDKRDTWDSPNTNITLKFVNESNHARNLLVYKNGELIYDVTNAEGG